MSRRKAPRPEPTWPKIGDVVDYCSVIGQPATQTDMLVTDGPMLIGPVWCYWLKGKSGCVSVDALLPCGSPNKAGAR